jgi:hypothetical protein
MCSSCQNNAVMFDQIADYVPIVSAANNLIVLFLKYVFIPTASLLGLSFSGRYVEEVLEEKSFFDILLLAIPVFGNIASFFLKRSLPELNDEQLQIVDEFLGGQIKWEEIPEDLKINEKFALAIVAKKGFALSCFSDVIKDKKKVVMAAVQQCGRALEYASLRLKNNKDVALAAVSQDGLALQYASEELRKNREVVLAAVTLRYASEELRIDKELVLAAVKGSGLALQYALEELKDDSDVVGAVVCQCP